MRKYEIVHLALKSEYSFKKAFGHLNDLKKFAVNGRFGIADINNTFSHPKLMQMKDVNPIYGVRLMVVMNSKTREKVFGPEMIFIAKNLTGLREIYALVKSAYDNFYYFPRISMFDVACLSENVIVIANNFFTEERIDFISLDHTTPYHIANNKSIPKVAIINNLYPEVEDESVYELFVSPKIEKSVSPGHILSTDEWYSVWGDDDAIENTHKIASMCNVEYEKSDNLRYTGKANLRDLCIKGAVKRGIDINDEKYSSRLDRELSLISEKNFSDYFLIVADIVQFAKKTMLVGPSRGSSAGSLVCYLTEITEIDPIPYDLIFERFIDINRPDYPDIDIDFPDSKRDKVYKYIEKTYGKDKVSHIATVSTMKPKVAIGEFAKSLCIPEYETIELKDSIIERSGGDARAALRILDTFSETKVGRAFIDKYPQMNIVSRIEGHARHTGVHAAGVVIGNEPLTTYASTNTNDDSIQMDKHDAEWSNLIKIDCLGLRTLSILEDVAKLAKFDFKMYYDLPLDEKEVYKMLTSGRMSGVFQFEGYALRTVASDMGVEKFDDIVAITSLARPGPLHSGGTQIFIDRRTGKKEVIYISNNEHYVNATKDTLGVIIFQEQLMKIAREMGNMKWEDVSALRKAAAKSKGEEFFNKYRDKFVNGAVENGVDEGEALEVWGNMVTFGSWGFNKSHAVSYALLSYWTAWVKWKYPLEFAVANLNHSRSPESTLQLLRDMVENDGLEYIPFDYDKSDVKWTVKDGIIIGGFTNLFGIGINKARDIMRKRDKGSPQTKSIKEKLADPKTDFDVLFPCKEMWGDIAANWQSHGLNMPITNIRDIQSGDEGDDPVEYLVIGKLIEKNLRDLNETASIAKRGGKIIEDNTKFLNFKIEDDTGLINARVGRFDYDDLGIDITEKGKINEDWYLLSGTITGKWRVLNINDVRCLTEIFGKDGITD